MNGPEARRRLLARIPLTPRRLQLADVSSDVLEGGEGPPVVLLHGPGASAAMWISVIPDLMAGQRVVVPDLPGHGASEMSDGPLSILTWLAELIERTWPLQVIEDAGDDPAVEQPEAFLTALRPVLESLPRQEFPA